MQRDDIAYWRPSAYAQDLAPLALYWSPQRGDNIVIATREGASSAQAAGYSFVRVEACVFHTQQPGTVPLRLYWSAQRGDNFTTATIVGAQSAEQGGYSLARVAESVLESPKGGQFYDCNQRGRAEC